MSIGADSLLCHVELLEISWELNGNGWKYPFPQCQDSENGIQCLRSLFSPNAESVGTQMGRGADLLLYYLELLGINVNMIRNTWNTPFPDFNPMRRRINSLRVHSPPKQIPWEWRWDLGWIRWCAIGNCLKSVWTWMKISEIPLSTAPNSRECDWKAWGCVLPQCWISRNPDDNRGRFIAATSGIVRNQLGPGLKQLVYTFPQPWYPVNEIQRLVSMLSQNAKSAGALMWIEVNWLMCHLELLWITCNLIGNTWNNPFCNFNSLRITTNNLKVHFPQCRFARNPDGN